jgi:hypothetical protein
MRAAPKYARIARSYPPRAVAWRAMAEWRVICSCGWTGECSSEWAARSVAKLHPTLAPANVEHITRVEPLPGEGKRQRSLV